MSAVRVSPAPSRRGLLSGAGSLVLAFTLAPRPARAQTALEEGGPPPRPDLPGSLKRNPRLESWIRIDRDGTVTVKTGKAELGQGIRTALAQVAAEELGMAPGALRFLTADTDETPNEGYTAGSHSMQDSGAAIRHAAAEVRAILLDLAAGRLGVPAESLDARDGAVVAADGRRIGFGELVRDLDLNVESRPDAKGRDPASHTVVGRSTPRLDIPAKVTGAPAYVQDMRPAGALHARVVRPPSYGATLRSVDEAVVRAMPGVVAVVRDGNFLAVVAETEHGAITAMSALAGRATWTESPTLPERSRLFDALDALPADEHTILNRGEGAAPAGPAAVDLTFRRHYQLHGSIGPSCALALFDGADLTVWSHAQGMFPLRAAIAEMLGLPPDRVRCIHAEGAGCYGHNGADDAAADAALVARAVPGRPVRVQLMREQEHRWEPYGPAMTTRVQAWLDGTGRVSGWEYLVRSNTHATRPPGAGNLLAARHLARPFAPPPPKPLPQPEGGGDRNAIPLYDLPRARVRHHFVPAMPLRVSALRALGAYMNVFSIESATDELARAAGADPVAFRLRHLPDPRAAEVVRMAAERYGWAGRRTVPGRRGHGFAFARYKNLGAYAAVALEVEAERETGRLRVVRAVAAVDSGEAVNPDGIRNQVEGGILQSASWTLYEEITFDRTRITSRDWSTYPILRFDAVPDSVDVHVIDRPGQPFLETGEASQGPTAGAIGNAVRDALGVRPCELPISRTRAVELAGL